MNFIGFQSYLYDRSRRDKWKQEKNMALIYKLLKLFKKQFQNLNVFFLKTLLIKGLELSNI